MSLFEWIGESLNPGSTGGCEMGSRDRDPRPRWATAFLLVVALSLLGGWCGLLWRWFQLDTLDDWFWPALATVIYLVFAYFIHPEPDYDNMGLLGGAFDHPFRFSDDINRHLLLLMILLWPGRFIAEALVDGFVMMLEVMWFDRFQEE